MINYFLSAIDYIVDENKVPYFLDGKIRDLIVTLSISEKGLLIKKILASKNTSRVLRFFNQNNTLSNILPYLSILKRVKQNKGRSKNAYEHTLRVIEKVPNDNTLLKTVALFHDFGKYDCWVKRENFYRHAEYSTYICRDLCKLYNISQSEEICAIVSGHMYPLDYQRRPDWTDKAIIRFIDRVGKEYALNIIKFACYDKRAEHDIDEYIMPILELEKRTKKILESNYV